MFAQPTPRIIGSAKFRITDENGKVNSFDSVASVLFVPDASALPSVLSARYIGREPATVSKQIRLEIFSRTPTLYLMKPPPLGGVAVKTITLQDTSVVEPGLWKIVYTVDLELTRPASDNELPLSSVCRFHSSVDGRELCVVPITMTLGGGVTVAPDTLDIGSVTVGDTVSKRVRVSSPDLESFGITELASADPAVSVSSELPKMRSTQHWLNLRFTATKANDGEATIRFKTDLQNLPTVEIRVRYTIREK